MLLQDLATLLPPVANIHATDDIALLRDISVVSTSWLLDCSDERSSTCVSW